MDRRLGIVLLSLLGAMSLSLGWVAGIAFSDSSEAAEAGPPPGESEPARREFAEPPSVAEVSKVMLAGDSVMAGLEPALGSALESSGVETEFVLTPSILRDATVRFTWSEKLEEFDPDVVVMLVGTWEAGIVSVGAGQSVAPGDPQWLEAYEAEILDPWVELTTAHGAHLIWIGAPLTPVTDTNLTFAILNAAYQSLDRRWEEVTYLDSSVVLAAPDGSYTDVTTLASGYIERTRQIDGLHLCAEGAVTLAEAVIVEIETMMPLDVRAGWQTGLWRDGEAYPAQNCPPI